MINDVDALTTEEIQALVTGAVSERLTIEYKEQLPTWNDGGRKEFLADVSSFANSAGGHIFYGIRDRRENNQPTGIPESAPGLANVGADETGRIEQIIRSGISPRLNGVKVRSFSGFESGPVIVVQIPKSWNPPHAVWFNETSKFWARDGHGKYQLNVEQIGAAFLATDSAGKRVRDFRIERIAAIGAGEGPVLLRPGRRLTLHLVPLSALSERETWPASQLETVSGHRLVPLSKQGYSHRINLDGFLRYWGPDYSAPLASYVQLFRNGIVEACDMLSLGREQSHPIYSKTLEDKLISGLSLYLQVQRDLGVKPPIALMVTLEGVRGVQFLINNDPFGRMSDHTIDRDKLFLPDVLIEDYQRSAGQILRPVFDTIYNAASFHNCPRYNAAGEYDSSMYQ